MFITREDLENSARASEALIQSVLKDKYLAEGETTYNDIVDRMMKAIEDFSKKENGSGWKDYADFEGIRQMLSEQKFIPAGSILSGLGVNGNNSSLSNCYVIPIESDSLEGIYEAQSKVARTCSYRGGVGVDFTILRPKNAKVNNAAGSTSGAVSYIPAFSDVVKLIGQGETVTYDENGKEIRAKKRRGALLASLDIRHPDIVDFIKCKAFPEQVFFKDYITGEYPKISGANLSVKATDEFMNCVGEDREWTFIFPDFEYDKEFYNKNWNGNYEDWEEKGGRFKTYGEMRARDLFNLIAKSAHATGCPGMLFIDTIVDYCPAASLSKELRPQTVNPCGEQPLNPWGACLLGAMNLPKFVIDPYTKNARWDEESFKESIRLATQFMNIVSDINESRHPLKEQREADKFGKRIGLEAMGLADSLSMMNLEYSKKEAIAKVRDIFETYNRFALKESQKIAKCLGCAPAFNLASKNAIDSFFSNEAFYDASDTSPMRNTALLTMGPTGSISILANNCSSGIEPVFSLAYKRRTNIGGGQEFVMLHKPATDWCLKNLDWFGQGKTVEEIKNKLNILEAHEIDYLSRLGMQESIQSYVDASISSTINLPNSATVEDVAEIYMQAFLRTLKGVTVYRDGCKRGVLEVVDSVPENSGKKLQWGQALDAPRVRPAVVETVTHNGESVYVTVSMGEDGNPIEIFVTLPRNYSFDPSTVTSEQLEENFRRHWDILARLTSLCLRYGAPVEKIVRQIQKVVPNINDSEALLARALKKFIPDTKEGDEMRCPECKEKTYIFENGCAVCKSCGYSKCS